MVIPLTETHLFLERSQGLRVPISRAARKAGLFPFPQISTFFRICVFLHAGGVCRNPPLPYPLQSAPLSHPFADSSRRVPRSLRRSKGALFHAPRRQSKQASLYPLAANPSKRSPVAPLIILSGQAAVVRES